MDLHRWVLYIYTFADYNIILSTLFCLDDYRGPGDDFPFMAYHIMAAAHILVSTAMIVLGLIHISLGKEDRMYFLLSGGVSLWCPLAVNTNTQTLHDAVKVL